MFIARTWTNLLALQTVSRQSLARSMSEHAMFVCWTYCRRGCFKADSVTPQLILEDEKAWWLDEKSEIDELDVDEEKAVDHHHVQPVAAPNPPSSPESHSKDKPLQEIEALVEALENGHDSVSACHVRLLNLYAVVRQSLKYTADVVLMLDVMDNLLRFVISRNSSLLVRAKASACKSPYQFLCDTDGVLSRDDYQVMCDGMRHAPHGMISVRKVRNAICEAEQPPGAFREGIHIEVLGGKVWRNHLRQGLFPRGWDMMYRMVGLVVPPKGAAALTWLHGKTPCATCALMETYTFADWARLRTLCYDGARYTKWQQPGEEDTLDVMFARYRAVPSSREFGRLSQMRVVSTGGRPKIGRKSAIMQLEGDSRSWVFVRFVGDAFFTAEPGHC